eukprot:5853480-Lingulodinium_polyedra.AAC.1
MVDAERRERPRGVGQLALFDMRRPPRLTKEVAGKVITRRLYGKTTGGRGRLQQQLQQVLDDRAALST